MQPGWRERWNQRQLLKRTPIDHWLDRHRARVRRMPRWLYGSLFFASLALGIYFAVTTSGPYPWFRALYGPASVFPGFATVVFTVLPYLIVVPTIAWFLFRHPPADLPGARARRR